MHQQFHMGRNLFKEFEIGKSKFTVRLNWETNLIFGVLLFCSWRFPWLCMLWKGVQIIFNYWQSSFFFTIINVYFSMFCYKNSKLKNHTSLRTFYKSHVHTNGSTKYYNNIEFYFPISLPILFILKKSHL